MSDHNACPHHGIPLCQVCPICHKVCEDGRRFDFERGVVGGMVFGGVTVFLICITLYGYVYG